MNIDPVYSMNSPSGNRPPLVAAAAALGAPAIAQDNLQLRGGNATSTRPAGAVAGDPVALQRANASWQALEKNLSYPEQPGFRDCLNNRKLPAGVWPFGQTMAASLDLAALSGNYAQVDRATATLAKFAKGEAYQPRLNGGRRFYDDNAWIGLNLMQAYKQTGNPQYLQRAEAMFPFFQGGLSPQGGLYWAENVAAPTRNTCSNGPAMEMALRLYMATHDQKYLDFAKTCDQFLNSTLRSPQGLYYDNVASNGTVSKAIYSYNQGTPIGADVLFYRITGDKTYLARATQTANAALDYFSRNDGLWKEAPSFNAIFFRNLLALDQVAPNPRYRQALNQYLDRVWTQGRDPKTGLFTQGGIGPQDGRGGNLIDQAGLAQLYALQAWPDNRLLDVS